MNWSMTVRCKVIQKGINGLTEELAGYKIVVIML